MAQQNTADKLTGKFDNILMSNKQNVWRKHTLCRLGMRQIWSATLPVRHI